MCDGNLYDYHHTGSDMRSFCVQYPAPEAVLTLEAWQEFMGFDQHGAQQPFQASFNPGSLELEITLTDAVTASYDGDDLHAALDPFPGIAKLKPGQNTIKLNAGLLKN